MPKKRCSKCKEEKGTSEFHKRSSSKDGLYWQCKECCSEGKRRWRQEHLERAREYDHRWRQEHLEQARERHCRWNREHPERMREITRCWVQEHPEQKRRWRQEHAEQVREARRRWNREHLEEERERQRRWAREHPEKARRAEALRRARKASAPGSFTREDIRRQYEVQNGLCFWCSEPLNNDFDVDHVIPLTRGGTNWPQNLVCACVQCNGSKNNRLAYTEWIPRKPLMGERG